MAQAKLTDKDIKQMDALVDDLLDLLEQGSLTKLQVRGIVTHLTIAAAEDNLSEVRNWLEEGRKLVRQPPYTDIG